MGHQSILFGMIEGPGDGPKMTALKVHNQSVIESLPTDDEWPWLTRAMFALPAPWPQGTYREQVIHFGLSIKDFPGSKPEHGSNAPFSDSVGCEGVDGWIGKFEDLLSRMYWFRARVHVSTEFEMEHGYLYTPSPGCVDLMLSDSPEPIDEWELSHSWLSE